MTNSKRTSRSTCGIGMLVVSVLAVMLLSVSAAAAAMISDPEADPGFPSGGGGGGGAGTAATTVVQAVQSSKAWVDVNADGKADYCRLVGWGPSLSCTLGPDLVSTWTATFASAHGEATGRAWADFNADGRADYCRVVDANGKRLRCTLSTSTNFSGSEITSAPIDPGQADGRAWVDHNGDGKADYCRAIDDGYHAPSLQCTVSTGTGFGTTYRTPESAWPGRYPLLGENAGRTWVDVSRPPDGKADYCRVITDEHWMSRVRCTTSTGTGFPHPDSQTCWIWACDIKLGSQNPAIDPGWGATRTWADFTGDGVPDYCRVIGYYQFACSTTFGEHFYSGNMEPGDDAGRAWTNFDGVTGADICRVKGSWVTCTLSQGTWWGASYSGGVGDAGYSAGRSWADVNGDAKADYCRVTGGWGDYRARCNISNPGGWPSAFASARVSGPIDPGWD